MKMMKNKSLKKLLSFFLFIALVVTSINVNVTNVYAAKIKNGTYYFYSGTSKVTIKNTKVIIKDSNKISAKNDEDFSKKKITVKKARNCKYYCEYFSRSDPSYHSKERVSKSKIKECFKADRDEYLMYGYVNNFANSRIVVKKGKVVKIVYCFLY